MVKEFLSQKGISYQDRDVSRDPSAVSELMGRTGRMAVPVTIVDGQTVIGFDRARLEQALSTAQATERPTFGAAVADAGKMTASTGGGASGAYVGKVRPGSAAERAGLAPGDIITEIDQQRVTGARDLENAVSRLGKGSRFAIVFSRNGQTMRAEGTL